MLGRGIVRRLDLRLCRRPEFDAVSVDYQAEDGNRLTDPATRRRSASICLCVVVYVSIGELRCRICHTSSASGPTRFDSDETQSSVICGNSVEIAKSTSPQKVANRSSSVVVASRIAVIRATLSSDNVAC